MSYQFKVVCAFFFAAILSAQHIAHAQVIVIADTDRDGIVSFSADAADKNNWSQNRGAVLLANVDSDLDNGAVDSADTVVNGAADALDLAVIKVAAIPSLPLGTDLTISVNSGSVANTRLFLENPANTFTLITSGAAGNIPGSLVRSGDVTVRLEAITFPTATWNGRVQVTVTAPSGTSPLTDNVTLQVAPFVLLPSTQPGSELYVRAMTGRNENFITQLQNLATTLSASIVVSPASAPYQYNDCWMQDAMEIGYTQIPSRTMNVVLKSNRGSSWLLSNFPKDELLGPNYGWITAGAYSATYGGGSPPNGWLDWFGNLEVTPPLPGYPRGRIYYGKNGTASLDPAIVAFLNAQGVQSPAVAIDTGWLEIKHVDEMTCWVPTGNPVSPYKLLVPDTTLMAGLLDAWVTAGHGSRPMLQVYYSGQTVSTMAANTTMRNTNATLQSTRINPAIEAMKTAFGITESDIIRIPAWYTSAGASYVPCMVNSVTLNGNLLVADPRGPVVSGVDLLQQDVRTRLAGLPLAVHFLDDEQYHKWSGNVHCATNVRRSALTPALFPVNPANVSDWQLY